MRKLIIVKKKKTKIHKIYKDAGKVLAAAAAILVCVGMVPVLQANAQEDGAIYHKHVGNCDTLGGCYGEPVYHIHKGSETEKGECFETPVYHEHQGNELEEGGCYLEPVCHVHQGDETQGGACYSPITHVHGSACYEQAQCLIIYDAESSFRTWDEWCFHHHMTSHGEANAVAKHQNCGAGNVKTTLTYCRSCGHGDEGYHDYSRFSCNADTSVITGYKLSCEKTEATIDSYVPNCNKTADTIDSYSQNCVKTAETIDSYDLNCGWDESMPCGKIIVTNETPGQVEKVILHVTIEDLTGGKLILAENPYAWQDKDGNSLGEGEYIEIDKNGSYKVTVKLENENVDKTRLEKKVQVDNVYVPDQSQEPSNNKEAETKGDDSNQENPEEEQAEIIPILSSPEPKQIVIEAQVLSPAASRTTAKKKVSEKSPSPMPIKTPVIEKEIVKVELQENEALDEIKYEPVQIEEKSSFFSLPAVRVISLTAGGLLLLGGFGLLILWKKKSVKLLNDDGEGKMYCVGHCPVVETEEGYTVYIRESMLERSSTNRFCIKPGFFLIGKEDGQELIICKEQKRISVSLNKEMTFVI